MQEDTCTEMKTNRSTQRNSASRNMFREKIIFKEHMALHIYLQFITGTNSLLVCKSEFPLSCFLRDVIWSNVMLEMFLYEQNITGEFICSNDGVLSSQKGFGLLSFGITYNMDFSIEKNRGYLKCVGKPFTNN